MSRALNYIGIARMSGNIELGEDNAKALIKQGRARLLLLASDASDGVRKRVEGYLYGFHAPLVELPYTKEEIGDAVGRAACAVAAVRDLGLAKSLADALAEEYGAKYTGAAEALRDKQEQIALRRMTRPKKTAKRRNSV